jgi:hypothetical protein
VGGNGGGGLNTETSQPGTAPGGQGGTIAGAPGGSPMNQGTLAASLSLRSTATTPGVLLAADGGIGNVGGSTDVPGEVATNGGDGGNGGIVFVSGTLGVTTLAATSAGGSSGIAVQVSANGGAGGAGGNDQNGVVDSASGDGGNGGNGGQAFFTLDSGSVLSAAGQGSHGLQVTANGGVGGADGSEDDSLVSNPENGGGAGSGGTVYLTNYGTITVTGDQAVGILAQANGGAGGGVSHAGGVLMALGGLCCMLDPRYRMRKKLQESS